MFWKNPRLWRVIRIAIPLLLTLLWLGFIFGNSLKDATASSEQSGRVHEIVNEVASSVGIEEPISEQTVRTMAHFTEFAILGALLCLNLWSIGLPTLRRKQPWDLLWLTLSLPISFLLACLDEFLQTFSEGRACDFLDVLTDTAGAALGVFGSMALFLLIRIAWIKKPTHT